MEEKRANDSFTSFKISTPFKIFILILLISGLAIIGYSLNKQGQDLRNIISLMIAVILTLALIYWFMTGGLKRVRDLSNISDTERLYMDDLNHSQLTQIIKRYVFSDMDIQNVLGFSIIMGNLLKWMLFYIFAVSSIVILIKGDTLINNVLMLFLAITWCPWVENIFLKMLNFKIIFFFKLLITIALFSVGIMLSP